ncbi:ribosome maturation factor RimM [Paramagnetospirillum magneticum]|uniref:Ribosome maturation factor RimM n=1 Tax=Paramagnetospirillum magneticum (strain ATCC 700264 / AMB-1) TaxID=342108 RepID=RIMM_PARM1|nr:ribosome maturation factor RimM [Paramagnetospirillum magneticum]Q2VZV7.1 RecName: Full=Ribosome maturation factor RimM [Paramagnetospirillum magneticum AMB-1]BAE52868.1 RimM protein, required for 16S rRNA processing [Paramagnetospirillum magneticum AMB-1]
MGPRVRVGVIVGVHGVRGAVRIKSFTEDPADIGFYSPVENEAGSIKYRLKVTGEVKGLVIATLDGIGDRDAAEALKGTELWVARERLPRLAEDEFLYSDLIGLVAEGVDGKRLGIVKAVADYGAGDVLDIKLEPKGDMMVPFTQASVPEVDIAGGRLVVVPPVYAPDENEEKSGGA